jgi:uncharacterized RDD family membrane protein YckC
MPLPSAVPESSPDTPPFPEPRIAPVWARFLSLLVDGALWMPVALAVAYAASRSPAWGVFLFPAGLISFVAYQVILHAFFGATLGKMLLRIRVVRTDFSPIDLNAALRRSFVDAVFRLGLAIVSVQVLRSLGPVPVDSVMAFIKALQANKSYATLSNLESVWTLSEVMTCLFNPQRRAIHDLIGGTLVVKRERT